MGVTTEFIIPAESFALEQTLRTVPGVTVEVERLATHSREWVMPFLWTSDADVGAVETALRDDPSVEEVQLLDRDGEVGYFNLHWSEDVQALIDRIVDRHGIVQEAEATGEYWYLTLQFVDREALAAFHQYFVERGYDFELKRLYAATAPKEREYDLTPAQREVLVTALEMGYFTVPREAQIGELAEALGISTNAVSQRLRRATGNLTSNLLTVSTPSGTEQEGER